jgi:hypothetical protein
MTKTLQGRFFFCPKKVKMEITPRRKSKKPPNPGANKIENASIVEQTTTDNNNNGSAFSVKNHESSEKLQYSQKNDLIGLLG